MNILFSALEKISGKQKTLFCGFYFFCGKKYVSFPSLAAAEDDDDDVKMQQSTIFFSKVEILKETFCFEDSQIGSLSIFCFGFFFNFPSIFFVF